MGAIASAYFERCHEAAETVDSAGSIEPTTLMTDVVFLGLVPVAGIESNSAWCPVPCYLDKMTAPSDKVARPRLMTNCTDSLYSARLSENSADGAAANWTMADLDAVYRVCAVSDWTSVSFGAGVKDQFYL